jgi:RNase H-like domain found in reverse transcriptase
MRKYLPHIASPEAALRDLEKRCNKENICIQSEIRNSKYLCEFEKIKHKIKEAKPLSHIDPNLKFYVQTDASTVGISGYKYIRSIQRIRASDS